MQSQMIFNTVSTKAALVLELTRENTATAIKSSMVMADASLEGLVLTSADFVGQTDLTLRKNVLYYLTSESQIAPVSDSSAVTEALQTYVDTQISSLQQGIYFMGGASALISTAAQAAVDALPAGVVEEGRGFMWIISTGGSFDNGGTVTSLPYGGSVIGSTDANGVLTFIINADDKTPTTNTLDVLDTTYALTGASVASIVDSITQLETRIGDAEAAIDDEVSLNLSWRRFENRQTRIGYAYSSSETSVALSNVAFSITGLTTVTLTLPNSAMDTIGISADGEVALSLEATNGQFVAIVGNAVRGASTTVITVNTNQTNPTEYNYSSGWLFNKATVLVKTADAFDVNNYYTKTEVDDAISTALASAATDATDKADAALQAAKDYTDVLRTDVDTLGNTLNDNIATLEDEVAQDLLRNSFWSNYQTYEAWVRSRVGTSVGNVRLICNNIATVSDWVQDKVTVLANITSGSLQTFSERFDWANLKNANGSSAVDVNGSVKVTLPIQLVTKNSVNGTFGNMMFAYVKYNTISNVLEEIDLFQTAAVYLNKANSSIAENDYNLDLNTVAGKTSLVTDWLIYNGNPFGTHTVKDIYFYPNHDMLEIEKKILHDNQEEAITELDITKEEKVNEFDFVVESGSTITLSPTGGLASKSGVGNYDKTAGIIVVDVTISKLTRGILLRDAATGEDIEPLGLLSQKIDNGKLIVKVKNDHNYENVTLTYLGN